MSFLFRGEGNEEVNGLSIITIRKVVAIRDVAFNDCRA
jgi:hypothetical protein